MTSHIPTSALPDDVKQEIEQQTWLQFAAVILLLVGAFNIIEGIAMVGNSSYVADNLLFANLDTWGWFFLIWGIIQIWAGIAVMRKAVWAALVGIVTCFINAVAQLSAEATFPFWSLTILAANVLCIYGLVRYGGPRRRRA